MNDKVKIQITEEEWLEFPEDKRQRLIEAMRGFGYDTQVLDFMQKEYSGKTKEDVAREEEVEDIYRQFYGEE